MRDVLSGWHDFSVPVSQALAQSYVRILGQGKSFCFVLFCFVCC